eukprot:3962414-Amphidinium_carterae.1
MAAGAATAPALNFSQYYLDLKAQYALPPHHTLFCKLLLDGGCIIYQVGLRSLSACTLEMLDSTVRGFLRSRNQIGTGMFGSTM